MGIAELGRFHRSYNQGDVIGSLGDVADEFYILNEGVVGIYRDGERVTRVTDPGDFFGELAVILSRPRSAEMRAESFVSCFAMPACSLDKLLISSPDMAVKLVHVVAERLYEVISRLGER